MHDKENLFKIPDGKIVTLTQMNHILEIQSMEKRNWKSSIKKISATEYITADGEIKEFENKAKNISESINSMYKTLKRLRYLINNNFTGALNELFLTLTYGENMQDTERLYNDFKKFFKRLRYKYKGITSIDYLNVIEPQQRGAWHCHILLRFNDIEKIYIPNKELAQMWGFGFVTVKRIDEVDNIGAYLTAYLTDMKIEDVDPQFLDENNITSYIVKTVDNKKYVKGARLYMYPPGINIYRCSRGIKKPDRVDMSYKKAKKYIGEATPTYSSQVSVKTDNFENSIIYQYYNTKRR